MTEDLDTRIDESLLRGDEVAEDKQEQEAQADAQQEVAQEEQKEETKPEPKPDRDQMIPRSRFDEVYRQAKEREEENERLRSLLEEKSEAKPEHVDIKVMRQEAYLAMIEGDSEKYADISAKIDEEIMARAKAEAKAEVEADINTRETVTKLEAVAAKAISEYPFLDPEGGNGQAIEEVIGWRDMYIAKGMRPHEALEKAVVKVAPMYAKEGNAEPIKDERTGKALERAIKSSEKQPPATSQIGVGQRGEDKTFNASNIPQSDWERMSEDERKKLLSA